MINITTAKRYLKLTNTLSDNDFVPFVPDAIIRYILPYIGDSLVSLLWQLHNHTLDAGSTARISQLMSNVEAPLARFTFLLAAPSLDINIGQNGFTTASGGNLVAASKERVSRFTSSIEELGYAGIESLLRFLYTNRASYPEWIESSAYSAWSKGFVRSADVFNRYYNIDGSYLRFFKLNQCMDSIELLVIAPLLGVSLFNALLTESISGEATGVRLQAIQLVERVIALHAGLQNPVGLCVRQPRGA